MRRVSALKKARNLIAEPVKTFRRQPVTNAKVFKRQASGSQRPARSESAS